MRHLQKYTLHLIHETAMNYALADVDSYIHIDNFMAINRQKFKPNARFVFAERTLLREAAAQPQRQGVQRTWGQAFSDFTKGGFAGLAKGKADLERNYTLAIQNLEQMLNLLDEHPESTSQEVIQTLNKSIGEIIKELQGKQQLIKKTSDQMKGVAMDKHRGEAPRGYTIHTVEDMNRSKLDKFNLYEDAKHSPEVLYTLNRTKYDSKDIKNLERNGFDLNAISEFGKQYANQYTDEHKKANIDPKIIYNYLKLSNRWQDAENMAYAKNPTLNPTIDLNQLQNLYVQLNTKFPDSKDKVFFNTMMQPFASKPADFSKELPGMVKILEKAIQTNSLIAAKARYLRLTKP
jgi:hypothetical protein